MLIFPRHPLTCLFISLSNYRQNYRQTHRQTDRQSLTHTHTPTDRQTDMESEADSLYKRIGYYEMLLIFLQLLSCFLLRCGGIVAVHLINEL